MEWISIRIRYENENLVRINAKLVDLWIGNRYFNILGINTFIANGIIINALVNVVKWIKIALIRGMGEWNENGLSLLRIHLIIERLEFGIGKYKKSRWANGRCYDVRPWS
jgi:hypothetical protein